MTTKKKSTKKTEEPKRGGARKNSGRNPVADKKRVYYLYIRDSIVKKNGGKDKMNAKIYKHIGQED